MPRVAKVHRFEAVRMAHDVVLVNERTGDRGKKIEAQGRYMVTNLDTGEQWYIRAEEFHRSGWAAVDPADSAYFGGFTSLGEP